MNAIEIENLSKRYIISHQGRSDTLRDAIASGAQGIWRSWRRGRMDREEFWALRDVSFEVAAGEVVGIIGRNGAGKSTLLKLLSRITEPTTGCITLNGRVASLLEVGTGFHPELSGRENVFLNGAILGMSRSEIRRRFDEIVAFAEVERFLDTPVKRYSSGMYVRLAFAVAAHLDPEILIVDEVLAVGDTVFQKKCLGRMQDVASAGRTVLLVSHNMASVLSLCTSCCLLDKGRLKEHSSVEVAIDRYNAFGASSNEARRIEVPLKDVQFLNEVTNESLKVVPIGSTFRISLEFRDDFVAEHFDIIVAFKHLKYDRVLSVSTHHCGFKCSTTRGRMIECQIANLRLLPGEYRLEVIIQLPQSTNVCGSIPLRIAEADIYGSGILPNGRFGVVAAEQTWAQLNHRTPPSN